MLTRATSRRAMTSPASSRLCWLTSGRQERPSERTAPWTVSSTGCRRSPTPVSSKRRSLIRNKPPGACLPRSFGPQPGTSSAPSFAGHTARSNSQQRAPSRLRGYGVALAINQTQLYLVVMGCVTDHRASHHGSDRRERYSVRHRGDLCQAHCVPHAGNLYEHAEGLPADDLTCHDDTFGQRCGRFQPSLGRRFGEAVAIRGPRVFIHA
jgi:hypothetical protein